MAEKRYIDGREILDEFFWDARSPTQASTIALVPGDTYFMTVHGNWSERASSGSSYGTSDAIMFGNGAGNNTARYDIDTQYASRSKPPRPLPYHTERFKLDLGDGNGHVHVEPDGGPYEEPKADHFYTYNIVGNGSTIEFLTTDDPFSDNGGGFWVIIYGGSVTRPALRLIQRDDAKR